MSFGIQHEDNKWPKKKDRGSSSLKDIMGREPDVLLYRQGGHPPRPVSDVHIVCGNETSEERPQHRTWRRWVTFHRRITISLLARSSSSRKGRRRGSPNYHLLPHAHNGYRPGVSTVTTNGRPTMTADVKRRQGLAFHGRAILSHTHP